MPPEGYIRVKNFEQFQHYKDRNPPWIKLYISLLDDYDFIKLSPENRYKTVAFFLLASLHDNYIPNDQEYISRRMGLEQPVDLQPIIDAGFISLCKHKARQVLAEDKQEDSPRARAESREEESREETEKRRKEKKEYTDDFEEAWKLYPSRPDNPKRSAFKAWNARLKEGVEPAELIGATARYAEHCRKEGIIGTKFVKMASTFYGPNEHWRETYEVEEEPYIPPPESEPLPEYTAEQVDLNRSGMTTIKDALAITKEGRPPSHNFQAEFEEIISKHGVESAPAQAYAHKWGNKLRMPDNDQM